MIPTDLATIADSFRALDYTPERLAFAHSKAAEVRGFLASPKLKDDERAAYTDALNKVLTFIREATAWNVAKLQTAEERAHGIGDA